MNLKTFALMYVLAVWIGTLGITLLVILLTMIFGGELNIDFNGLHNNWPEGARMSPQVAILLPMVTILGTAMLLTPWAYSQFKPQMGIYARETNA